MFGASDLDDVASCPSSSPSCSQLHGFTVGIAVLDRSPLLKQSGVKCSRQTDVLVDDGPNQSLRRIWTNFTQSAKRAGSAYLSGKLCSDPLVDKHPRTTHFRPISYKSKLILEQRISTLSTQWKNRRVAFSVPGPRYITRRPKITVRVSVNGTLTNR